MAPSVTAENRSRQIQPDYFTRRCAERGSDLLFARSIRQFVGEGDNEPVATDREKQALNEALTIA
ncbi:hypothetical protein PQR02_31360 [Paraburkholderia sediminicola]|uniref:Uncharacterized protein n=1 Tax=Paraburkholderia rhynchosiae TaxID=487049 RepID=A0ACC7NIR8_9BURK